MILLTNYKSTLSFRVDKPKDIVIQYLTNKIKQGDIEGHTIQIKLKPTFFDTTSGRGIINITVNQSAKDNSSTILVEVIPTSITRENLYILAVIILLWTIVALIISFSFYSLLTILVGWIVMPIVIHLTQKLNKGKLENYISELLSGLKNTKMNTSA